MSYTPQWGQGPSGQPPPPPPPYGQQPDPYGQQPDPYGQSGGYGQSQSGGYGQSGNYGQSQSGNYGGQSQSGNYGGQSNVYGQSQPGMYGQPPQQPPNQFGGGFGLPSGPPSQPPRRRGGFGRVLRFLIPLALVAALAIGYPTVIRPLLAKLGNDSAQEAEEEAKAGARTAQVGECVVDKNTPAGASEPADSDDVALRVVACDSAEAGYKVLGIVNNKLQSQATDEVCDPFPDSDVVYWEGYAGKPGLVLCLQQLKK
jgi:hypothetical protein